jgi:hypothetical protein
MSAYYGFPTSYEIYHFNSRWWAGTVWENGGCINRVYLSDQFEGELGEGVLWKGVLAHEWAHVLQGKNCVNNEWNADKIAMQKMWEAGEIEAWFRWGIYLQVAKGWSYDSAMEQIYAMD